MTNLVNDAPLSSIGDGVKHDGAFLGSQWLLGLDALIELNQLLGDGLAKQFDHGLAVILGNGVDLGLAVVRIVVGLAGVGGSDPLVGHGL